jgi:hypothetical protein
MENYRPAITPAIEDLTGLGGWFLWKELGNRFQGRGFLFGNPGQKVPQARLHENLAEAAVHGQGQSLDFARLEA